MPAPARAEDTDWAQIDLLYANLERLQPSPVVTLNRAVAVNKVRGPAAALAMIEPLDERLAGYFYFHGVKGALLQQLDRRAEARKAFDRAIALANTPAEAAHIRQHLDQFGQGTRLAGARHSGVLSAIDTESRSLVTLSAPVLVVRPWSRSNQRRST